jgi:hypothetical protein
MSGNTEEYRGYIINWDVSDDNKTGLWKGTGVVRESQDRSGSADIYSVPGRVYGFKSGEEARDYILRTAKEWIDETLRQRGAPAKET